MVSLDGSNKCINDDIIFMDFYYMFLKLKEDGGDEGECYKNYTGALLRCLLKIEQLQPGNEQRSYLDWMRWNKNVIKIQLGELAANPKLQDNREEVDEIMKNITLLIDEHFKLSETEKGINNQYVQAYRQLQRIKGKSHGSYSLICQNAGRLLINYFNNVTKRCCVNVFPRDDYTHVQLQNETNWLTAELKELNHNDLANDIHS